MIIITLILVTSCFLATADQQQDELNLFFNTYKEWLGSNDKHYGVEELAARFAVWKENYDYVQDYNSRNPTVKLEINKFADMGPEEFSALYSGLNSGTDIQRELDEVSDKPAETENSKADNNKTDFVNNTDINSTAEGNGTDKTNNTNETASDANDTNNTSNVTKDVYFSYDPSVPLPESVDWRNHGAVSSVKSQKKCGGCWAFSTVGALEGLYGIIHNKSVSLSEQQLIDCSWSYGNTGCWGGGISTALRYTKDKGVQLQEDYPYVAKGEDCKYNSEKVVFKNVGYQKVKRNDTLSLKAAVARQPVSVGIEAFGRAVQFYKSGIVAEDCTAEVNHGVLIVGYNKTAEGQEYWIVKNSWGPRWGQEGYIHIAMGDQNKGAGICGINTMGVFPTI